MRKQQEGPGVAELAVTNVPVEAIEVKDQQLRHSQEDDDIIELATDLARRGILQPIGVKRIEPGRWQLLWGGRRLAAAKRLGWKLIPATLYEKTGEPIKAVALVENLQRRNLSLQEEVDAVNFLHKEERLSTDQISVMLSKSRDWVLRRLAVPALPIGVREALLEGKIGLGVAEEISKVEDTSTQGFLLNEAIHGRWTVLEVRAAIKALEKASEEDARIEEAVRAGVEAESSPVMIRCQACGKAREMEEITIVRVCKNGCEKEEEEWQRQEKT